MSQSQLQVLLEGGQPTDVDALRDEVRQALSEATSMLAAWDQACDLAACFAQQCAGLAENLFPEYHEDDYMRGIMVGEGHAYSRCQAAFSHLGNAMRMAEAAKGGGDE